MSKFSVLHGNNLMVYHKPLVSSMHISSSLNNDLSLYVHFPSFLDVSKTNAHTMTIWSKDGVYKPKLLATSLSPDGVLFKPRNLKEGINCPKWRSIMQKDIDVLLSHETMELVVFSIRLSHISYK